MADLSIYFPNPLALSFLCFSSTFPLNNLDLLPKRQGTVIAVLSDDVPAFDSLSLSLSLRIEWIAHQATNSALRIECGSIITVTPLLNS